MRETIKTQGRVEERGKRGEKDGKTKKGKQLKIAGKKKEERVKERIKHKTSSGRNLM